MSHFVLIHGAWHGGWCWNKVVHLLEEQGQSVSAPDLPGHGGDTTPASDVDLDRYVDSVIRVIEGIDQPVVLAGHSMAGMVITQAAEKIPDRIKHLVYLTAFLPANGQSLAGLERKNPDPRVPPLLIVAQDGLTATLQADAIPGLFYHDCDQDDIDFALDHLCPQPLPLLETPVQISAERFGTVRKSYIKCTDDQALGLAFQEKMIAHYPDITGCTLRASHSPFYSMPGELVQLLLDIAGE